ncbi:hypothetical protein AC54_1653 [Escherichia coli 8-415-05_S3_C3]|jgi:hypothetical protein|nr:hypothetical protein EcF11_2616 [Escherichia coli F11]EFJ93609.1 hypothetical protein HMPREF9531_01286 [Escherichia coli MS 45-1]EGB84526.1 hypothetical protein HMPREF9533_00611 [Escherichia coli MS 60-1]ESC89484.1 hypothetical protein HMPREF1593_05185 [Escherichia coli 907391]KEN33547.1 hypothetical protein AC54_1653 [Escherichia coli 8-415-05_S3_C3]CCQ04652.1 hypothetical protein [Escherichia coli Nissle 1917]
MSVAFCRVMLAVLSLLPLKIKLNFIAFFLTGLSGSGAFFYRY